MRRMAIGVWLLVLGCGRALSPDEAHVYATLNGAISQGTRARSDDPVRVALGWTVVVAGPDGAPAGGRVVRAAQDVAVEPRFPAAFRLEVTSLPPPEAMRAVSRDDGPADPQSRFATASLLVYEDRNHNQQLDFTPFIADALVDQLIGFPGEEGSGGTTSYEVFYWEGPAPSPEAFQGTGAQIRPGFQVRKDHYAADAGVETVVPTFLDSATELSIELSADPQWSCFLVDPLPVKLPGRGLYRPFIPFLLPCYENTPFPGGEVECLPAPINFYLSSQVLPEGAPAIQSLCGASARRCMVVGDPAKDPGDVLLPPPPGWPCSFP